MEQKSTNEIDSKHLTQETFNSKFLAFRMHANKMLLIHGGQSSHALNTKILEAVEHKLLRMKERTLVRKRILNVLMECLGNLSNHAHPTDDPFFNSTIIVSQNQHSYIIESANRVEKQEMPALKQRLEKINALDEQSLRNMYAQVLDSNTISCKGGAGLGIIDIARKASGKLNYEFTELNDGCSLFTLSINVSRLKSENYQSHEHTTYTQNR